MIALYGGDVETIRKNNYSLYVALWIHRERSLVRKSLAVTNGLRAVVTPLFGKQMEDSWFAHITETDAQAIYAKEIQAPVRASND